MMVLLEIMIEARPFLMTARKSCKGSLSTEETEFFFSPKANPVFKQEPNHHLCGYSSLFTPRHLEKNEGPRV